MTDHYVIGPIRELYNALVAIGQPGQEFETLDLRALSQRTQMRRLTQNLPGKEKEPTRRIA